MYMKISASDKITYQHKNLANGEWCKLSLIEQMANIGSEVERAIKWKNKGKEAIAYNAFTRALELFDLTINDDKNSKRLKETTRARELWGDFFTGKNIYKNTDKSWRKYFYNFNFAARI